jgi:CARDB
MALRHAAALILCAASIQFAGEPALAQNAPINNAPITNVPNIVIPDALPDLVVTKADATLTCVGGNQVIATIAMTIVNKGPKVSADMSKMLVAYEARWHATSGGDALAGPITAIKPSGGIATPLKPGQSYSNTMVIQGIPEYKKTVPKKAQYYAFEVWADPAKQLPESNETNNAKGEFEADPCPK